MAKNNPVGCIEMPDLNLNLKNVIITIWFCFEIYTEKPFQFILITP
jgi:hypothetical protein